MANFWNRVKDWLVGDAPDTPEEHQTMKSMEALQCADMSPQRVIRGKHKTPKKDGMKHLRAVAKSITEEHEHAED
jgi:hypothetical protein